MSWNKVNLSQIAEIKNGYAFKSGEYQNNGVRVIRITNVQKGRVVDLDPKFISEINSNVYDDYMLYQDDILISLTGNVGRVAMFQDNLGPAVLNQRVGCIRVKKVKQINPKYLFQFLNTSDFESTCIENSNGIAQLNLSSKYLENVEIPLPPLSEQIQIAEILTQAETLIAQRKESIRLLDELVKSQFLEMFGDPVKNEKGWEVNELGKLVDSNCPLTYGIVQPGNEYANGIPVIRPVDLTEFGVKRDQLKRIDPNISNQFKRTILKGNEILMCVRGTTGVASLATKDLEGCNVTRGITPIWFSENYNSLFAYTLFQSDSFMSEIKKLTYGVTLQQINLGDLRKMKLINPPLMLQVQFSQFFENIRIQRDFYHRGLLSLENMYSSLSQKAFRGELTFAKENLESRVKTQTQKEQVPQESGKLLALKPTNVDFYKRTVLAAEIVWRLHKEPTFGHLKLQKLLYLCIRTSNMQLPVNFSQQAMGPYDPQLMRSIDKQLQEKKWFRYNKENPLKYEPLMNVGQHEADFQKYYSSEQEGIFSLIKKFKTTKSDTVEIVATLYACLENIIEQGAVFSEVLLMKMFYDWSDRKKVFDELEVRKVFKKMRDSGILPKGV